MSNMVNKKKKESGEMINVFTTNTKRFRGYTSKHSDFIKKALAVGVLLVPVIVVVILANRLKHEQASKIGAEGGTALLYISPESQTLPPGSTFQVWVDTNEPLAYANMEISFDKRLVNLASDATVVGGLDRDIRVSSMDEANSSGVLNVVAGLDPASRDNPPSGIIQLAEFTLVPITTEGQELSISFNETSTQLVSIDSSSFSLTTQGSNLTINPGSTPTPTLTPQPSSTSPPVLDSCASYCRLNNYSTGTCRQNKRQCERRGRGEVYVPAGDPFCPEKKNQDTCCCI